MYNHIKSSRRRFLKNTSMALLGSSVLGSAASSRASESDHAGLISSIDHSVIIDGRNGTNNFAWFHPRCCMVPTANSPLAVMTMQSIAGSDYFGHVNFTTSADLGKTWTKPCPIPGLGRQPRGANKSEGVCDVVPEYHGKTDTVLAIGHSVHYKDGRLARPQDPRWPVYTVRDREGNWSKPQKLEWDDPRGAKIYTCGCDQRTVLPDGNLIIPLCAIAAAKGARGRVGSVLASYDGRKVAIRRVGNFLKLEKGRGLLEPSLTMLDGRHYMTIRAEDGRGYVSTSLDGLTWSDIRPWSWEDGKPLDMSTTQQHWLTHSDGLYLVYTRRTEKNYNVMRWRAPLFVARVDRKTLRLVRESEKVVLPLIGDGVNDAKNVARMGNFHVTRATPDQSWVTVGECLPHNKWRGDVLLSRINWAKKNRLV